MASATEIKQFQLPNDTTKYDLIAKNGIFYIEGTGTTAGTWLGSHADITAYYEGLTVAYKVPVKGASTTTLNINSLGATKVVKQVSTAVSTSYGVNAVVLLIYTLDGTTAYWKVADYSASGDITEVKAGNGLTGGGTSGSVTLNVGAGAGIAVAADAVKAKLRSETALTVDSAAATTTSGRVYPVAVDKTGYLAVNVPWTDTNTHAVSSVNGKTGAVELTYSNVNAAAATHNHAANEIISGTIASARLPAATQSVLGGVKIGDNINVSSGTISVSAANTSTVGVAKLHKADDCISYTSDDGGVTPAAVKKAVSLFGNNLYVKKAGDTITGNILFSNTASTQSGQPNIKWKTIKENTPFMGFATDQSDGTFVLASLKGTNYTSGLAIGGGSGNLLWKGTKVATVSDIVTYSAITNAQIDSICGASISNLSEVNF